ncbi:hypothetical protein MKEN_00486200 [Mycena kentingensis (nom. inval.)]|nr:hypothetical protein MKEN_00486200 [Mycena kentingensis (nom. inval.)]
MTCSQDEMIEVEQLLGLYVDELEKLVEDEKMLGLYDDHFDILSDLCSDSDTEDDTRLSRPPSSDSPQSSELSLDTNIDATQEDAPAGTNLSAVHTEAKYDGDYTLGVETTHASKQRGAIWRDPASRTYAALHSAGNNLPVRRGFQAAPTRIPIPTNPPRIDSEAVFPLLHTLTPAFIHEHPHATTIITSQNSTSVDPHRIASRTFFPPVLAAHTSTPNTASATSLLHVPAPANPSSTRIFTSEPRSLGTFCAAPTRIIIPGAVPRSQPPAHSKTVQQAKSSRRLLGF